MAVPTSPGPAEPTGAPAREGGVRLGLIGANIDASLAPRLHRLAGRLAGVDVVYDLLVPKRLGLDFEQTFALARDRGYRGVNVTYPYKERAAGLVEVADPAERRIGAVNTVTFEGPQPLGFNTDCSGFAAAYRARRGELPPGAVLMIGTGGVGRAVAFALLALGVQGMRLVDRDPVKRQHLAEALARVAPDCDISEHAAPEPAAAGVDGVINCTPVGMVGHAGTPVAAAALCGAAWAFDAVYTPPDTQFLQDAAAAGLAIVPGWDLFFFQGVHAWRHFTNLPLDEHALRSALIRADAPETP